MWRHPHHHIWLSSVREGEFYMWTHSSPLPCKNVIKQIARTRQSRPLYFDGHHFKSSICSRFHSGMASKVLPSLWYTTVLPRWEIKVQSADLSVLPSLWYTTVLPGWEIQSGTIRWFNSSTLPVVHYCTTRVRDRGTIRWFNSSILPVVHYCTTKGEIDVQSGDLTGVNLWPSSTLNCDVELCEAVWRLTERITGLALWISSRITSTINSFIISMSDSQASSHAPHRPITKCTDGEVKKNCCLSVVFEFKNFLKCLFGQTGRAKLVPLYLQAVEMWNPSIVHCRF